MSKKQRLQYTILVLTGLMALFAFAILWFNPANIPHNFSGPLRFVDFILFAIVSYVIWFPLFMKFLTFAVASHIRQNEEQVPQQGLKVAFITTYVPNSESSSLLHRTLPAMIAADYPHDVWLLDEGDDDEAKAICKQYGVKHFSRANFKHWNTADGKYARKTKGGNHNAWYNAHGDHYDIVAQIDTDFKPRKDFLTKTLGYFNDPAIAWVGTPQIYGNDSHSLIARGAAQQTYNFYGPLLRGMDGMESTLLIGANHIIRVAALRSVDHYSAHITEDLLTGMKLHAKGYRSVYVPEALAVGEGPTTWKAYFNQQHRWAYGCMHILFNHSFSLFKFMTWRRIAYYFCIQQYYFSGIAMVLGILSLSLYFLTGIQSISLDFSAFLFSYIGIAATVMFIEFWLQRFNVRPLYEKGIMWAGMFICIAAWPVFFKAFVSLIKRKHIVFKVTPKGMKTKKQSIPINLFAPHLFFGFVSISGFISSFYTHRDSLIMLFWSFLAGATLLIVPFVPYLSKKYSLLHKTQAVEPSFEYQLESTAP